MVLMGFTIQIMQHLSELPFSSSTGIGCTLSERASTKIVRIWLVHATSNGTWYYIYKKRKILLMLNEKVYILWNT